MKLNKENQKNEINKEDLEFYYKYLKAIDEYSDNDSENRNEINKIYLKNVLDISSNYMNKGLSLEDLVQAGNLGLLEESDKCLDDEIKYFICIALSKEIWKKPIELEILKNAGLTKKQIHYYNKKKYKEVSLNNLDRNYEEEDKLEEVILKETLNSILNELTDREQKILYLRFGFKDGNPETLEKIGNQFGITKERVRQIIVESLDKLRNLMFKTYKNGNLLKK